MSEFSIPISVAKTDADQHLVFGWASVVEKNGKLIVDKQGDVIYPEDLEKAAYDFVHDAREQGHMHSKIGVGKAIESIVFTKEKQDALGIDLGKVGWWIGFKVSDPAVWKRIKAGDLPEFSIGGSGRRKALDQRYVPFAEAVGEAQKYAPFGEALKSASVKATSFAEELAALEDDEDTETTGASSGVPIAITAKRIEGPPSAEKRGHMDNIDITTVAKQMVAEGLPSALYTRADFLEALNKRAQAERSGTETPEQCFTRLVTSDPDAVALYKAHRASPGHDPDRAPKAEPVAKTSASLDKLRELAADLHKSEPLLSHEQAFAKVYTDPANRALARAERAENRPGMAVAKSRGTAPVADRVAALAASLARAHRDLSHDAAIAAILQRNPDLAACYRQEQQQTGRGPN
jgi:Putative phage serine protease XkdF